MKGRRSTAVQNFTHTISEVVQRGVYTALIYTETSMQLPGSPNPLPRSLRTWIHVSPVPSGGVRLKFRVPLCRPLEHTDNCYSNCNLGFHDVDHLSTLIEVTVTSQLAHPTHLCRLKPSETSTCPTVNVLFDTLSLYKNVKQTKTFDKETILVRNWQRITGIQSLAGPKMPGLFKTLHHYVYGQTMLTR